MGREPTSQTQGHAATVEPSRAWILGLVVDADGSVLDPLPAEPEWPAPAHDQITPPDGPPVRS